ncbi:MAG: TraB/GumN family protein, partial [Gammaproteobacteria bacterium]|nr:TraB/GumN family protein [Gammaproteobacteria bacterium]
MRQSLLIVLSFFVFSSANAANDKAFIWQVNSENSVIYLMGSIHFADKSFYPLRQEIEDAFNRSKYLVVELDTSQIDSDTYNQLVSQKGTYKKGKTIKDVVSKETWLRLRQQLRQLNIDYDDVKNLKPGMLVLTLSAIQAVQMGLDPQLGIDNHFLLKAVESPSKQIIELETLQQQISLFLNIPNADLLLQESLYSLDEAETLMTELIRYWKQGDELKMNKLLFEDAIVQYPAFAEIYDRLFYQRNQQMTEKID